MSGDVDAVATRPRPLSGGLFSRTLFSWLRRDEHSSSSESLSSAGSDRTAASFAFLAPAHYDSAIAPIVLRSPSPPTDSYKRRVRERNLRRQHDGDLTIHRKYGLFRAEGIGNYNTFNSLNTRISDRSNRQERERRAASECLQRRSAYVPGKRRAPLPPGRTNSIGPPTLLNRPYSRKRPAPQPPEKLIEKAKENIEKIKQINNNYLVPMNSKSVQDNRLLTNNDNSLGCKPEKYSKKDINAKDVKHKTEKGFLKQIFENRKRNSTIETAPERILPSISELDKQAAEIIETCKLKLLEENNNSDSESRKNNSQKIKAHSEETWFCTKCLNKYNASVVTCLRCTAEHKKTNESVKDNSSNNILLNVSNIYTQTDNKIPNNASTSRINGLDEREKLKEILKEMKNSLPKKPKHDNPDFIKNKTKSVSTKSKEMSTNKNTSIIETPTLRIGSVTQNENNISSTPLLSSLNNICEISSIEKTKNESVLSKNIKPTEVTETKSIISEKIQLKDNINVKKETEKNKSQIVSKATTSNSMVEVTNVDLPNTVNPKESFNVCNSNKNLNNTTEVQRNLHTPLKISSLLNPVYVPKNTISDKQLSRNLFFSQMQSQPLKSQTEITFKSSIPIKENFDISTSATDSVPISQVKESVKPKESKIIKDNGNKNKEKPQSSTENIPLTKSVVLPSDSGISILSQQKTSNILFPTSSDVTSSSKVKHFNKELLPLDQHTKRRDLINQLEQSIAKGDERAAAEAAAKLAQLRLSCSVLSFSSQIIGETSTSNRDTENLKLNNRKENIIQTSSGHVSAKVNTTTQSTGTVLTKDNSKHLNLNVNSKTTSTTTEVQERKKISPETKISHLNNIQHSAQKDLIATQKSSNQASISKETKNDNISDMVTIEIWVEDKEAARGPIQLSISRQAIMGELREQAERSLGLAAKLQRWIVGRMLCTDDNMPLISLAGPNFNAPFYLCLVQSETRKEVSSTINSKETATDIAERKERNEDEKTGNVYTELVQLEQRALVPNTETFECGICMEECATGGGAVLRDCIHAFCRDCLSDVIRHCEEPAVSCPATGCSGILQEREIRALVSPVDYERWLARGLAAAESGTRNAFHCRTRDCTGWALCEPGVQRFPCPVCKRNNCVPCQAIHEGNTCEEHRANLQAVTNSNTNRTDEGTRALLDTLISRGEALECPECSAIITKKWGCDWVKCSACKTEICWVTRGRRWGPGGRGDISGGCRCGIDGKRCHPSCGYCH